MFTKALLGFGAFIIFMLSGLAKALVLAAFLHYLWPYFIPTMYPQVVAAGYAPAQISFISAFAAFEIIGIFISLIKGS